MEGHRQDLIYGRRPVLETLRSGRPVHKLYLLTGARGVDPELFSLARERGIPVVRCSRARLNRLTAGANHQGLAARVAVRPFAPLQELFEGALAAGEPPFFLVLDGIQDPGNFGALLRTAEAAGVHGVIVGVRRSCGLTSAVSRASAGADQHLPVARVERLECTLEEMAHSGIRTVAADPAAEVECFQADLTGPVALVLGSEGEGLHERVLAACVQRVHIPLRGRVGSLNVSAAGAVLLYETLRQRRRGR